MLRVILRPGWIALGVVVIAFAVACFTLLAPWQLGKNSSTNERNDLIRAAVDTDPVPLAELAPDGRFVPSHEWHEVLVSGHFLPQDQVLVRLRNVEERPATEVVVPFAVAGGNRVIAVNRGYVRPENGATPAVPATPDGQVTITARIRAAEGTTAGRGAHREGDRTAVYSIDPAEISRATGVALDQFYLQLSPNQPGSLGEIPLPQLDSGPYLSYGLQWLAFGIMAPLGAGYFLFSEIRHRRRKAAAATKAATSGADPGRGDEAVQVPARSDRRRQAKHDLREAGMTSGSRQVGQIGSGPAAAEPAVGVRDKLSERYGG